MSKYLFGKYWIGVLLAVSLLIPSLRLLSPLTPIPGEANSIWIEIGQLILLYGYISLVALGLGLLMLKKFSALLFIELERILLAFTIGMAALSILVALLGFSGLLTRFPLFLSLIGGGLLAYNPLVKLNQSLPRLRLRKINDRFLIFLRVVCVVTVPLIFVECLTPVWDYDALLYHLDVPFSFLSAGRIYFDPEIFRSAYPYYGEMLFLVGMAFNLAPLAKLISFTFAILFVVSVYAFSRRLVGRNVSYVVAVILIGAPAFWVWASWATVDFAWGVYELWSVIAVVRWARTVTSGSRQWLILAGMMSGFAVGIKYLSLPSAAIIAGLIVWKSLTPSENRIKEVTINLALFGCSAALIGGVWYLRNVFVTGNAFYPLVVGGPGWEPLEDLVLQGYMQTFGTGRSILDYLLLPFNVYIRHNNFSTIGIELIHPILWLLFLAPFILWKQKRMRSLVAYCLAGFFIWAYSLQVIRFLVPLTGPMAILSAVVVVRSPTVLRRIFIVIIAVGILFNLVFQIQWLADKPTLDYLTGQTSAAQYLEKMNPDQRVIEYARRNFADAEKALFLWDGRGYYCEDFCVADDEQSAAILLSYDNPLPSDLAADLRRRGFTHLMLSVPDVGWFIQNHDPQDLHRKAYLYFRDRFIPQCGRLIFQDEGFMLNEIICK